VAETMKAVIAAEVDATGVVRGVNKATAELQRLNQTASRGATSAGITATLNSIQVAYQVVSGIIGKLNERAKSLTDITTKYDLQAANAKTRFEVEQIKANKRIAAALSPAVQESYRLQTEAARAEAARVESQRGMIGGGITGQTKIALAAQQASNVGMDIGGAAVGAGTRTAPVLTPLGVVPVGEKFNPYKMAMEFGIELANRLRSTY